MYTTRDFKTKKQLKQALKDGESISVFQPGPFGGSEPSNGEVSLEGPHYPAAHSWYARATLRDGLVIKVQ
jgi:hypothetical protein